MNSPAKQHTRPVSEPDDLRARRDDEFDDFEEPAGSGKEPIGKGERGSGDPPRPSRTIDDEGIVEDTSPSDEERVR